jgi:prolyl-tRNA synthetase
MKGVPVRLEVGGKELVEKTVTIARRDNGEKQTVARDQILATVEKLLQDIQKGLFDRAKGFLDTNTREATSYDEFKNIMSSSRGFIKAFWCEDAACEATIKGETKASTRCLPLDAPEEKGKCIHCGNPATRRWLFAQSY